MVQNIFQNWTETTQDISVSPEWCMIIADQCYITESLFFDYIRNSRLNIIVEVFPFQSVNNIFSHPLESVSEEIMKKKFYYSNNVLIILLIAKGHFPFPNVYPENSDR